MWEEHPTYQKAQAAGIVVGLALWFVILGIYAVRKPDWALLQFCVIAVGVLAFLPVSLWCGGKLVRWFRARPSSNRAGAVLRQKP